MRIDLKCCCGATASFDTPRGTYAGPGGKPVGPRQRVFRVELLADDWLDRHTGCKPMFPEAFAGAITVTPEGGSDHAE